MRPISLILSYLVLALAPLVLATHLFDGMDNPARLLAIAFGLVAFAMLLLQFISSGRFESLSKRVGINHTMRFHQITARVALLLVLLHPVLFFPPESMGAVPQSASMLMRMMGSSFMMSGTIALALTLFIVATGIWRHRLPVRYEIWRAAHVLGVTVIAIAGAHHVFSVGGNSREHLLRSFWWVLLIVALGALAYTYFIKPWFLARHAYRVKQVRELGPGLHELTLDTAPERAIDFTAGQFAWVNFRGAIPLLDNPFSISSSPDQLPEVQFLIKANGDMSTRVGQLKRGHAVYLDAPHGNFTLEYRDARALCLIAGGIGIAPIISILRDLAHKRDPRPTSVLYGAGMPEKLVCIDELRKLQDSLKFNLYCLVDEAPRDWNGGVGQLDAQTLRHNLPAEPQDCLCMICGPTPMMLAVERQLKQLGVLPKNIVYERFEYD